MNRLSNGMALPAGKRKLYGDRSVTTYEPAGKRFDIFRTDLVSTTVKVYTVKRMLMI
jgi:hypothetical protein